MAQNKKDFANANVATAPSPATSGLSLVVAAGKGVDFPPVPFYVTAVDNGVLATNSTAEVLLVTAVSTDTFTIVRAQKGTSAKSITNTWRIFNGIYVDDVLRYNDNTHVPIPAKFTSFESLNSGWGDWYGNGTISHDSTDKINGTASLKIVTEGAGELNGAQKNITDVDWSTKNLRIWVKATDWSEVFQASILVSTGITQFDNFFACNLKDFITSPPNNEWIEVYLSRSNFIVGAGVPDWALVNDMILRVIDNSSGVATVWFDALGAFEEADSGMISVVFDDGWDDGYTQGKVKLDEYGIKGTYYIIPELLGGAGYMTEAQIDELHEAGHEIAGHGLTNLTTLSSDERKAHLSYTKEWLSENGYRGKDLYAYPEGGYNEDVVKDTNKYFSVARALAVGSTPASGFNPGYVNSRTVVSGDSTGTIQSVIDDAVTNKKWLILVFHLIVTTPSVDTEYSIANFGTVIDYIQTQNVPIVPAGEAIRRLS